MKSLILLPAALLAACNPQSGAQAQERATSASAGKPFTVTTIADFDAPWAMTFLPDGRMLVTEKAGTLLLVSADGKTKTPIATMPVMAEGQGGLMDVVLHPKFAQNHLVYFSYSEARADGLKGVVLARGTFVEGAVPELGKIETLFRANSYVEGNGHFSGRIAFAPDGHLFFTNGERQKFTPAQDPKVTLGKVLRLNDDGTPAAGNPLAAKGFDPTIWSYGHRNLLGIAFDAKGNLWEIEMGPKGGDEVNLVQPGRNYGWPNASNGSNYDGSDIPDHKPGDGFEPPKVWWNPSISPADLIVYSGKAFPQWQGDIFIPALSGKALIRVDVNGTNATKGDQWDMAARIREVEQGPDGAIWLLEDGGESQGRLLKLTPAR
ncbi:PQQ-dependent sugar dehydrogenase [Sphingomonas sp. MMS12-HWE2-04]|uniref:PQQ-dependent sugar dehydrogenase n=1 Tax=Sphingomonas sp. MMS12-HWE2-04 TaxID=3234199 RepID=UPI0038517B79